MSIMLFLISLIASGIGAITGIGGGIIIKPAIDASGLMSVSTASFLSGITVLSMTSVSLILNLRAIQDFKRVIYLSIGAVIGGVYGKWMFEYAKVTLDSDRFVTILQSSLLLLLIILIFLYIINKENIALPEGIQSKISQNILIFIMVGCVFGFIAAFLGIGGGLVNIAVLSLVFLMDERSCVINSLFIIFISQVSSLIFSVSSGTVPNFEAVQLILMICGGIGGGLIGGQILRKINNKNINRLFLTVLLFMSLLCIYNIFI